MPHQQMTGPKPSRPALGRDDGALDAKAAVESLVQALQAGWDEHDADLTDAQFADDILWGSPFGATLQGYDRLHEIHVRLKQQGVGGAASRFDAVQVLAPAADVVVAHIRRRALDDDGRPLEPSDDTSGPFSEMALYVLVKRDGVWWVAAGHNTPLVAAG